jgi:uncharacterized protein with HEPN domain
MNVAENDQFIAKRLIDITTKEVFYLDLSRNHLRQYKIDLYWISSLPNNLQQNETLEAFVSRFGRLQDTLGEKLLPIALRLNFEKTGSQLENLMIAEKLGWIQSAAEWLELRFLRNRLVHEYMDSSETLLSALQIALDKTDILIKIQSHLQKNIEKIIS